LHHLFRKQAFSSLLLMLLAGLLLTTVVAKGALLASPDAVPGLPWFPAGPLAIGGFGVLYLIVAQEAIRN
jgi:hypothetical protein